MTNLQKLQLRQSEIRQRLNALGQSEELNETETAEVGTLTAEYQDGETRSRALMVAEDATVEATAHSPDAEARELIKLESQVKLSTYILGAVEMRAAAGPELEFNQALGLGANQVPLQILADSEVRTTTDTDVVTRPRGWLDRLMADSAATHLGLTMAQVPAGEISYPVTSTGGVPIQRGREEAAAVSAWTLGVTEIKPTRMSLHYEFAIEDAARISGLEEALRRDMRAALTQTVDLTVFRGDAGANENVADITGFFASAAVETTLTQAKKILWPDTLAAFTGMIDGLHAESLGDLRVVASVGANQLWLSTIALATENQTMAQVLKANGLMWRTRHGIETLSAADDFMAAIGLQRGMAGAGVIAMWPGAELIRDVYSGAASGKVGLSLHALWNWALVRSSNFKRLKAVT